MPVVHIHMFEGRTDEQKSAVVKGVTEVLTNAARSPRRRDHGSHPRNQEVKLG